MDYKQAEKLFNDYRWWDTYPTSLMLSVISNRPGGGLSYYYFEARLLPWNKPKIPKKRKTL